MLKPNPPLATFLGIRFVLFGFDPINERKVRSKLINGGGVDAGNYSENCTHVIVDKIVYDDPVCVSARKDRKMLVTELWVDHSFDIGVPVDATSIMYRPLGDLNGIPGAKSLTVCLTGYLRQDRDDIMTMVGLMGAQFSKPMVANKVTHLVCYKLEGEKYELASKLKRIKLVNHRWLEDCLKKWELLSEDNYNKSTYDLEMIEAEAKGSEEGADYNTGEKKNLSHVNKSPGNFRMRTPRATELLKSAGEVPNISDNLREPYDQLGGVNAKNMPMPGIEIIANHAAGSARVCTFEVSGCQDADAFKDATSIELPGPYESTSNSLKLDEDLNSISRSSEKVTVLDAEVSASSYLRRTPRKSPASLSSSETGIVRGSPEGPPSDSSNLSTARVECETVLTESGCAKIPLEGSGLNCEEPSSRKMQIVDVSYSDSRSQISHDAQVCLKQSSSVIYKMQGRESASSIDGLSKTYHHSAISNHGLPVDGVISLSAVQNLHGNNSASKSSELKKKPLVGDHTILESMASETRQMEDSNNKSSRRSFEGLVDSKFVAKPDIVDLAAEKSKHNVAEAGSAHNQLHDEGISSPWKRKSETEKAEAGKDELCTKPVRKKTLAKKTLGYRPNLKSSAKKKGFISLNKYNLQNGPAISLTMGRESVRHEKLSDLNYLETSTVNAPEVDAKPNLFINLEDDILEKANIMDEETEATEEKHMDVHNKMTSDVFDFSHKADSKIETKSEEVQCVTNNFAICMYGDAMEDENVENKNVAEHQTSERKNRPSWKTKTKTGLAVGLKAVCKDVLDREKQHGGKNLHEKATRKEKDEPSPLGQTKRKAIPGKRSKSSTDAEKESELVIYKDQNISPANGDVEKTAVKSNVMAKKINQTIGKGKNCSLVVRETLNHMKVETVWFILSGQKLQRKEFQQIIRRLKGKLCRDSHQWSYQATHFIAPNPLRRTEKFFAAAASGRWILKSDYLTACIQEGRFLAEEPYEWHRNGLSEDGAINLEAPRKWRLSREKTGHGAFYGMRIIIYGECITPPLDTLKRVLKAGDGTILATSPPYTRFFTYGVDYAVVSPGMPRSDLWVQEFLKHEIPCIVADYLVEFVCKPGYSLERHVLYDTHAWVEKSLSNLLKKAEDIVGDLMPMDNSDDGDDVACQVCGSYDRGEVMLICGDESGSVGCGVGMHIDCCDPPLGDVPKEDWFCPNCSGNKNITAPKKRQKGVASLKTK